MDDTELLWRFYQENAAQGRHHEQQRTAVTSFFTALAAAAFSVIALDKCLSGSDLPLIWLLISSGLFGAILSIKQYERFRHHMRRAKSYRDEIDLRQPSVRINKLRSEADADPDCPSPVAGRWRFAALWTSLHLLVVVLGIALAVQTTNGALPCPV